MSDDAKIRLPRSITIPRDTVLCTAPTKTERHGRWYQYVIQIGDNHVAYLTLDDDAIRALSGLPAQPSIY